MNFRIKFRLYIMTCLLVLALIGCSYQNVSKDTGSGAYPWKEKSQYLVDHTIIGETVQFRYAMTYCNTSEYDIGISHVVCSFQPNELSNWYAPASTNLFENIQTGFVDVEDREIIVPSGQEELVIFVFEGTYLGGKIPDTLSAPEKVVWGERVYPSGNSSEA